MNKTEAIIAMCHGNKIKNRQSCYYYYFFDGCVFFQHGIGTSDKKAIDINTKIDNGWEIYEPIVYVSFLEAWEYMTSNENGAVATRLKGSNANYKVFNGKLSKDVNRLKDNDPCYAFCYIDNDMINGKWELIKN